MAKRPSPSVIITCEHGGHRIPKSFASWFDGHRALLGTHRGFDFGAAALARELGRAFGSVPHIATTSRLLVDLNRSLAHRALFSELTRPLPAAVRERILSEHYHPYRQRVRRSVGAAIGAGRPVLHLSAHSFTPILGGEVRRADVGLLYDPTRPLERAYCRRLRELLHDELPGLLVRRNYPYLGRADGHTTGLRRVFGPSHYAGVEIEINQRLFDDARAAAKILKRLSACARRASVA